MISISVAPNDLVNGCVELVGAVLTWRSFVQLRRDRRVNGIYWPLLAYFSARGLWKLVYYPSLEQWFSFAVGVILVAGNVAWVFLLAWIALEDK